MSVNGCGDEPAAPPQTGRPQPVKKAAAVQTEDKDVAKEVRKEMKYFYDPSGKRDPFLPFLSAVSVSVDEKGVEEVPLTELQKYELSQLKLVAIMRIGAKAVAMVEDPSGKGHTLYIGTVVGKNRGKVVSIVDGKVSIEEKYRDIMGDINSNIKELVIEASEGGKK